MRRLSKCCNSSCVYYAAVRWIVGEVVIFGFLDAQKAKTIRKHMRVSSSTGFGCTAQNQLKLANTMHESFDCVGGTTIRTTRTQNHRTGRTVCTVCICCSAIVCGTCCAALLCMHERFDCTKRITCNTFQFQDKTPHRCKIAYLAVLFC